MTQDPTMQTREEEQDQGASSAAEQVARASTLPLGQDQHSAGEGRPFGYCDPAEAVVLDLLESLQEGLSCDAGLSDADRAAMRSQCDALDEALAQIRDIPRPTPAWQTDLARGLRLIAKHSHGTVSLQGELLSFEDLLGIAAREIEPFRPGSAPADAALSSGSPPVSPDAARNAGQSEGGAE